jgi:hypothetical protein
MPTNTMQAKVDGTCPPHICTITLEEMIHRCSADTCHRKLDLVAQSLQCKCKKTFCQEHRAAVEHSCSFDFKASATENLLKTMSTPVIAMKVDKI